MNREEAIAFGKRVIELGLNDETQAFCELAISALEKNESAGEWYKLLCEKWDSAENKGEWSRHTRVEPVYSIDGVKTWGDKCQCNKCTFTTIAVEGFGYYNFCPNCGADMRGVSE